MVRLYWWDAWLASDPTVVGTDPLVTTTAHFVDVDAVECRPDKSDYLIAHAQANAHNIDNNVGWWESITLTISEDELSRPLVTTGLGALTGTNYAKGLLGGQGVALYVKNAVESWENARFRWIQAEAVNGGMVLRVTLTKAPTRAHPADNDVFNEYTYLLNGEVFHYNTTI